MAVFLLLALAGLSVPGQAAPVGLCSVAPDPNHPSGALVNCSGRGFRAIPFALPLNTTTLLLARNQLTAVANLSFPLVPQLRELDLSGNLIHSLQPQAFRGLVHLAHLSLYDNCLVLSSHTYPPDLFAPLVSLKTLNLSRNIPYPQNSTLAESGQALSDGVAGLGDPHPAVKCLKLQRKGLTLPSRQGVRRADTLHTKHGKTGPLASLTIETFHIHGGQVQATNFDYPGEALSHLTSLCHLSIDGVANKTFGPGFQKLTKLTRLDLNGNIGRCQMVTLDGNTFRNLPNITDLDLTQCNIFRLAPDAFKGLQSLETLDLSFNVGIGFDQLGGAFDGLSHTKLTSLTIDLITHGRSLGKILKPSHLKSFEKLTHLQQLQARFNRLEGVTDGLLCGSMPPNLRHIDVGGNLWQLAPYVNDLQCLTSLERLQVDGMDGYWTPPLRPPDQSPAPPGSIRQNGSQRQAPASVAPVRAAALASGALGGQRPGGGPRRRFQVPPRLQVFSARNLGLNYRLHNVGVAVNSLQKIDLSQNYIPEWRGRLYGFHNVTELHLMNTFADRVSISFFRAFPALQVLNISSNDLRFVFQRDTRGQIFQGLNNLRVLDISRNNLGHFPNNTLLPLRNLEKLVLIVNGMGTFTLALTHMHKLQHLDISLNQLHTIPKETRDHLDRLAERMNVTVNMAFNPISCVCSNIQFLRWIRESKVFFGTEKNYFCLQADGSQKEMENLKATIAKLEVECSSYVGMFVGASAACIICFTVLLVALAYRFRWKLRYLYYASRLSLQQQRRQRQRQRQEFQFDAFVSFSSEDRDFVEGQLRQEMEGGHGLRLCIHTRDFTPGQYIASNIVRSVQRSRRTLVVLSRALLASDWCHYELQMALMEAVHTGRDVLIFLLYENVPAEELSRDMLANLQATVYIEFPHTENDRHLFWARLALALRE